ncbi:MAG: hypothetical protein IIZ12_03600 [Eggerthellaceae bacterium]|nr:hypothetical protein [Eggerthellaceae bacterium]
MIDNRTAELREKLTERGVEYTTNDHLGVCETSWDGFTAMQLTPSAKLIMTVTPDQAIAVTLGEKPRDKTEEWLLKACNQATQDYVKALEELVRDMWREITTCPDYAVPPCMTDGICERVRNLGVEMGGDDDE